MSDVFREIREQPWEVLVRHWNWKSAIFSSAIRATIFLFTSLRAGWRAAMGAMLVEFLFRPVVSGFLGSLTQAFRFAAPFWLACTIMMILLPLVSHIAEFTVHWLHGTPNLMAGIAGSVAFSWFSTLMNLYAMRRGVMVVNAPDAAPIGRDLKRFPLIFAGFVAAVPLAVYRRLRRAS